MWPFRKPTVQSVGNPADYGTNHCEPINPGRELAKMRNPDKRRSYKAFHDHWRQEQGKPPIVWAD